MIYSLVYRKRIIKVVDRLTASWIDVFIPWAPVHRTTKVKIVKTRRALQLLGVLTCRAMYMCAI